jgi:type IV fimbrial biogenesis protein FimT
VVKNKFNQGFTLVELMVTLAVAAIILAIAAPSFSQMIRENRLITTANNLVGNIQLARSEAIRRGVQVTMLPVVDDDWSQGWNIFTDWNPDNDLSNVSANNACAVNVNCFLVQQSALNTSISISTGSKIDNGIRFFPTGEMRGIGESTINDTFDICIQGVNVRSVILNTIGRPRVSVQNNVCS